MRIGLSYVLAGVLLVTSPSFAAPDPAADLQVRILFDASSETPDLVTVRVVGPRADGAVDGTPKQWRRILRVVAVEPDFAGDATELPSLLGTFEWRGELGRTGELSFSPRFPPAPGMELRVAFDGAEWDGLTSRPGRLETPTPSSFARFKIPELARRARARVSAVEPREQVPSNLLRFYVHFSHPMAADGVPENVRLFTAEGHEVETAFVDIPDGLWDPQRRRLTLWVHPGRVKRGVGPRQVLGPVLVSGSTYTLRVERSAEDADGAPLVEPFEMRFEVGEPDYRAPDPHHWQLDVPERGGEPLRAHLLERADRALLERLLMVLDGSGRPLPGRAEVAPDGKTWTFLPERPWTPGSYRLAVPPELEDASGNRPGRAFEASSEERVELPTIYLSFNIADFDVEVDTMEPAVTDKP